MWSAGTAEDHREGDQKHNRDDEADKPHPLAVRTTAVQSRQTKPETTAS
jgi:hypothetical protein